MVLTYLMTNWVEVVAVGFSLAAVILTVKKRILCWPVGLIGVVAYALLFWQLKLYAEVGLQMIFFAQGVYGWYFWARGGVRSAPAPVSRIGLRRLSTLLLALVAGAAALGFLLLRFTDASLPYLDAFLALTSLTANLLLARKVLESWYLWILVDVLYIGLFWYKGVYLSAGLYAVFLGLATAGLLGWLADERRKEAKPARSPEPAPA